MQARPNPTVLAIGSSHLVAILAAYKRLQEIGAAPFRLVAIQANEERFRGGPTRMVDGFAINVALAAEVERLSREIRPDHVLASLGGNVHNAVGLVNHPQPFDFLLPESPDEPLHPAAEAIPYALVVATVRARNQHFAAMTRAAHALTGKLPMHQLCSPPPIGDEAHIRAHPGFFGERIEEHGVAPARLRYKLWRAYRAALIAVSDELGIGFLDVPEASMDEHGYLRSDLFGSDPTHGNGRYGRLVLEQVAKLGRSIPAEAVA